MNIILASASPRRIELLGKIVDKFAIRPVDIDETTNPLLSPEEYTAAVAHKKGEAAMRLCGHSSVVISADTIVEHGGKILGKPADRKHAADMLAELSGSTHRVYTSVWVFAGTEMCNITEKTSVEFYSLDEKRIKDYVATGESDDKAGAYGIQGAGMRFVKKLDGDYFNVMGLPVIELNALLKRMNILQ